MTAPRGFLAFDLGGTRIKAGVGLDKAVVDLQAVATPASIDAALATIEQLGHGLLSAHPCAGVGMCVPGIVEDGVILSLPGKLPGAEGRDLAGYLATAFAMPSLVVNDAIAYGAGEAMAGAGSGWRRVVVLTIGTGVGTTVFDGGVPVMSGPFGGGILGGQIPISESTGPWLDTSGRPGSIEAFCRAGRLVDYAQEAGSAAASVEAVYQQFAAGDAAARHAVETYRGHLVRAIVALAHAYAPEVVILGGGPMAPGNPLLPGLEEEVNARLFGTYRTHLALTRLGDAAGLVGLAELHRAAAAG